MGAPARISGTCFFRGLELGSEKRNFLVFGVCRFPFWAGGKEDEKSREKERSMHLKVEGKVRRT
ncbi:hypothetical protein SPI_05313 [Niveomyces insectorum RCEF 264]|uniref:Uncharacterized protein n=1 Tax=Niveomyces insectorum RCEF 264 TaxID=1081102 RepID=A0A167U6I0_9HYPO|nr:hypothetical protein SPI_05313 [Niveomyces insectorum RCEF 264]